MSRVIEVNYLVRRGDSYQDAGGEFGHRADAFRFNEKANAEWAAKQANRFRRKGKNPKARVVKVTVRAIGKLETVDALIAELERKWSAAWKDELAARPFGLPIIDAKTREHIAECINLKTRVGGTAQEIVIEGSVEGSVPSFYSHVPKGAGNYAVTMPKDP